MSDISDKTINVGKLAFTFDHFLEPAELESIRTYAMQMAERFTTATTVQIGSPTTLDLTRRRADVLLDIDTGEVGKLFKARIEKLLPEVLANMHLPARKPQRVSVQITSTGDGGFYKPHTDNSLRDLRRRLLSFVYFCNSYPVSFQGGELRIYGTYLHSAIEDPDVKVELVSPLQNRIVFFLSDCVHEICPVICGDGGIGDGRLTVNGWIYFG
jgi:SM-20-related protein